MATAGSFAARLAEVAYSTTLGGAYTAVEKLKNPNFKGKNDVAEDSSNDDGGFKSYQYTWKDGEISFEMVADENATGQEAVWASYNNNTRLFWRLRPRGDVAGDRQIRVQGCVTVLEEILDHGDVARYKVMIQCTGTQTRDTQ